MHILAQNQSYDTQARTLTLGHKVPPCFIFFCRRIFASHCRQLHHAAVMIPHKTHGRSNMCNLYTPGITPLTHTFHSTLRCAASSLYSISSLLGPCPALSLSELPPGQPLIRTLQPPFLPYPLPWDCSSPPLRLSLTFSAGHSPAALFSTCSIPLTLLTSPGLLQERCSPGSGALQVVVLCSFCWKCNMHKTYRGQQSLRSCQMVAIYPKYLFEWTYFKKCINRLTD